MLFLLLALITADDSAPVPQAYEEFFKSNDAVKSKAIEPLQKRLDALELKLKYETARGPVGQLRGEIKQIQKRIEQLDQTSPTVSLGLQPSTNQIGHIYYNGTVHTIIDEHTAVIKLNIGPAFVTLTKISTKDLKARQPFASAAIWQVTAVKPTNDDIHKLAVPRSYYYEVQPVSPAELATHRIRYDELLKAAAAK